MKAGKKLATLGRKKIIKKTRPNSVSKKYNTNEKRKPFWRKQKKGVVYLSHIPHGFYENQIKEYFGQFGEVTGVNVPRSKSGRARGFAFVEFKHPDVAKIAAETMDNYLMHNRVMKAKYIEPKEQKPHIFRFLEDASYKSAQEKSMLNIETNRHCKNDVLEEKRESEKVNKLQVRKRKRDQKLNDMGILYKYEVSLK